MPEGRLCGSAAGVGWIYDFRRVVVQVRPHAPLESITPHLSTEPRSPSLYACVHADRRHRQPTECDTILKTEYKPATLPGGEQFVCLPSESACFNTQMCHRA